MASPPRQFGSQKNGCDQLQRTLRLSVSVMSYTLSKQKINKLIIMNTISVDFASLNGLLHKQLSYVIFSPLAERAVSCHVITW